MAKRTDLDENLVINIDSQASLLSLSDPLSNFESMTPQRWQQIKEVFLAVLECQPDEREAYLNKACIGDEQLLTEVRSFIAGNEILGSFLDKPVLKLSEPVCSESDMGRTIPPQSLGHYRILSPLGKGGMGEVFLAEDVRLERKVAIKLLSSNFAVYQERLRRFFFEAKAASMLNHPNILTIYDIGESETGHFIVMEFINGHTLLEKAAEHLSFELLIEWAGQIALALNTAHEAGIVHRDIKPANIMVRDDGYVKVLDFGLARFIDKNRDIAVNEIDASDIPGKIMGTIAYMSPEQARGEEIDSATDIFSFGIILYEMITGQHPFRSDTIISTLDAITTKSVLRPSSLNPQYASLDTLILQMLDKNPRVRPTAAVVKSALTDAARQCAIAAHGLMIGGEKPYIVGRDKDKAKLSAGFELALKGSGSMICVAGEPGIGKTSLVEDFLVDLAVNNQPFRIARGYCSERLAGNEAYLPFLELLDNLMRTYDGNAIASLLRSIAPTWYMQVMPRSDTASGHTAESDNQPLTQERIKREMVSFLQAISTERALVIFIEDLHWADDSSIDLLAYISARLTSMPLLILISFRQTELLATKNPFLSVKLDLQCRGICREIALDLLLPCDIASYLKLKFPKNCFQDSDIQLIYQKTEGNPLFMVDLIRYLQVRKIIVEQDGVWLFNPLSPEVEDELPESVRSMVEKKIAVFEGEDKRLLVAAAVQGVFFDTTTIARTLQLDDEVVEGILDRLDRIYTFVRLVDEQWLPGRVPTTRYRFVHSLYHKLLYESIGRSRKIAMSRSVAAVLEDLYRERAEEIALDLSKHFNIAGDVSKTAYYLHLAGLRALRVSAYKEATWHFRSALELLETLPEDQPCLELKLDAIMNLSTSIKVIDGYSNDEGLRLSDQATAIAKRLGAYAKIAPVLFSLWVSYLLKLELHKALHFAQEFLQAGLKLNDKTILMQANFAIGNTLFWLGDFPGARKYLDEFFNYYDVDKLPEYLVTSGHDPKSPTLMHIALLEFFQGNGDRAQQIQQELLESAEAIQNPFNLAVVLQSGAYLEYLMGNDQVALEYSERLIQVSTEYNFTYFLGLGKLFKGWSLIKQDRTREGLFEADDGYKNFLCSNGEKAMHSLYSLIMAEGHLLSGAADQAIKVIDYGLEVAYNCSELCYESELYRLKGKAFLQTGDYESAETNFYKAIEIAEDRQAPAFELAARESIKALSARKAEATE